MAAGWNWAAKPWCRPEAKTAAGQSSQFKIERIADLARQLSLSPRNLQRDGSGAGGVCRGLQPSQPRSSTGSSRVTSEYTTAGTNR